jgi:capsular exopolysaccharide synthesis family protein
MDLNQYVALLRAHWLLVLTAVVACMLGAGLLAWSRTPTYAAQTQSFVSTSAAGTDPSQTYQGGLFAQQRVQSYAAIVSSPAVTRPVIAQLRLPEDVRQLQAQIQASVPTDTVLLDITVKDHSARRAAAIANAVTWHFATFVGTLENPQGGRRPPVKVIVTSPADVPASPVSPRKPVYLALGLVFGLGLGIAAAVLRTALDKRIRTEDDAAIIARAPVLGGIPEDPKAAHRPRVIADEPDSTAAEAYRRLRTNLRALAGPERAQSFVVTSAVGSEGKTLVAANLAIAFAQAGLRVVLVDADMRGPGLAMVFGLSSASGGLSALLDDEVTVDAALQTWRPGLPLEILPSGRQPAQPGNGLESPRLAATLDALGDRADVVIVDAPALQVAADAAILTRLIRRTLIVMRLESTPAAQLDAAARSVRAVDGQLLGVVLNRVRRRNAKGQGTFAQAPGPEIAERRTVAPDARR